MFIARWGLTTVGLLTVILALSLLLIPDGVGRWVAGGVAAALWLFSLNFFRNPPRTPPPGADHLVSSADGVVADSETVDAPDFIAGRALRIGVFMNVFDVHVNRAPADGTVAWLHYAPGRFLDVRHPTAIHANEAQNIGLELDVPGHEGLRIIVRQLAGLVARRIVCPCSEGDHWQRGAVFGMIKFGSRLELWIPEGRATATVTIGQRVRAGETVLAVLIPSPPDAPAPAPSAGQQEVDNG